MDENKERRLLLSVTEEDGNEFLNIQLGRPFYDDVTAPGLMLEVVLTTRDCQLESVDGKVQADHNSFDGQGNWTAIFELFVPAGVETRIVKVSIKSKLLAEARFLAIFYARREIYRTCTFSLRPQ